MSKCTIDHSERDVIQKLREQRTYMPNELAENCERFLDRPLEQGTLNEVFHLLKKYDLASDKERLERNQKMEQLFS